MQALKLAQKENQENRHEIRTLHREIERREEELEKRKGDQSGTAALPAETEDPASAEGDSASYPCCHLDRHVTVYGGFESFHAQLLKLLPDIRIIPASDHIDVTPVCNADVVFPQTSKSSHSGYYEVRDARRAGGVPCYHLS